MRRRSGRGFTLLELMMVVAVTGILAMIALPSYQSYLYRAKAAEVVLVLDKIRTVLAGLQADRGAALGTDLKVTTGGWEVHSYLASQGQGSMTKVGELGQADLSHPRLGVEVAVTSGWYNTNQPGQYKVSISWVPAGHGRDDLAASSRQVALAVAQIMKPHAYLSTVGSTETSLYFLLPAAGASQGGTTTPPQPVVVTPQPQVTTPKPPATTTQTTTPPSTTSGGQAYTWGPLGTPILLPQGSQSTTTPPKPQQYDPGWYMNPSTNTPPPHARPPVSATTTDPGWYMDPPKTQQPQDPGWYMDPPKTQQPKDPGWYMDPINRSWSTTP